MRVLITGSSGFIGTKLKSILVANGHNVVGYDRSSDTSETLDNINCLEKKIDGIEAVYHLAGISNPFSKDLDKVNVQGTQNLVDVIKRQDRDVKLIFSSTFGVYKNPLKGQIIDEDFAILPRNDYGRSKLKAENVVSSYKNSIIARLSNVYGPSMKPGNHSVVANFVESIKKDRELIINNRNSTRDFIYIDDVVAALQLFCNSKFSGIFNICSSKETKIEDLVLSLEKIMRKNVKVKFLENDTSDGFWCGSYQKMEKYFKWRPKTSFIDGLKSVVKNE